jgi:hypothetical protein
MSKALTSFALVGVLTAALMALSLARHGYPFGAVGVHRLDSIADAGTFLPLAACYFFSALLMMILPIRAAGLVLANAADVIFWCVVVLFATITGCLAARWAFGQSNALWALELAVPFRSRHRRMSPRHKRASAQYPAPKPVHSYLRRNGHGLPALVFLNLTSSSFASSSSWSRIGHCLMLVAGSIRRGTCMLLRRFRQMVTGPQKVDWALGVMFIVAIGALLVAVVFFEIELVLPQG